MRSDAASAGGSSAMIHAVVSTTGSSYYAMFLAPSDHTGASLRPLTQYGFTVMP
jgi:hypothetical protein